MAPNQTYYIDPRNGNDHKAGTSPDRPLKTYTNLDLLPGDTVLFKRGSVIRDMLHTRNGTEGAPITYGAYGDGPKPAFLGSVAANNPECWVEERPSIWRYTGELPGEVCNLVFKDGESCGLPAATTAAQAGNLRYALEDLKHPGEWHYTSVGAVVWGGPETVIPPCGMHQRSAALMARLETAGPHSRAYSSHGGTQHAPDPIDAYRPAVPRRLEFRPESVTTPARRNLQHCNRGPTMRPHGTELE